MRLHRLINDLGRVTDTLAVLETRLCKAMYRLARTNFHLETLEAQQTAYHQAPVKILFLLRIPVTLNPPQELFCRLTSAVKLLTHLAMKKLRMGGIP